MNKYISPSIWLLEVLGVLDTGRSLVFKWLKILIYVTLTLSLLYTGILELTLMSNDFGHFNDTLSPSLIGIVGLTKYIALVYYRKETVDLIYKINNTMINGDISESDELIMNRYDEAGRTLSKIMLVIDFGIGTAISIQNMPDYFLRSVVHPPLDFYNVWNFNSTGIFVMVYFQQVTAVWLHTVTFMTTNLWSIFLTYHACGHFTVLQKYLERIADDEDWVAYGQMDVCHRIAKCVRLHDNLCTMVDTIEDFFTLSNLIHFLVSAVGICTSGYELTGDVDLELLIKHVSSITGQFTQLFLVNWCGQLIQDKSFGVSLAVYRSNFYKLEPRHQKGINLILVRAQRPMYITAGKFYNLSLESIAMILKAAMSCFALFTNAGEQQEN